MKIVICPDSFKGSISSVGAAEAIARGAARAGLPSGVETLCVPLADGGEGTVDALVTATGGSIHKVRVHDPLMREIDSFFGILGDGSTAVVEMAAASGLCLLASDERNPLITSTYGTGELLLAAIEAGAKKIIIGIGGSATNDGGTGAMTALGVRFLDDNRMPLPPGGAALARLAHIDMSHLRFLISDVKLEIASDVSNPLLGTHGASAVYGPQKGATPEMVAALDAALENYATILKREIGTDVAEMPGAGAAGGLGAGLIAFLGAELKPGIDMILDAVRFDDVLVGADLVITGEGRIDEQTAYGKTIRGVLDRAVKQGVPIVAVAGSVSDDIGPLLDLGLTAAFSIAPGAVSIEYAMEHAGELIERVTMHIVRLAGVGSVSWGG
ncbi:MAG: glycerate kinase [Armatimonadota bacterium]|nr:glycerate kinase [bacterium]